jgi:hypothetical protein
MSIYEFCNRLTEFTTLAEAYQPMAQLLHDIEASRPADEVVAAERAARAGRIVANYNRTTRR